MKSADQLIDFRSLSDAEKEFLYSKSNAIRNYTHTIHNTPATEIDRLRIKRNEKWIQVAATSLLSKVSPEKVCSFWSDAADSILKELWAMVFERNSSVALFGLGKLGAQELNISSDVDLCFYCSQQPTEEDFRLVKKFISLASERSDFGFLFRVDSDLKPGGRMAPVVASIKQMSDYYWSSGETWERLALTRARFICGSEATAQEVLNFISQYSYRKYLDYSLLEDLQHLRGLIHRHVRPTDNDAIHLKLCPGGIRDIELFIHSLLIIHGGKIPELRVTSTNKAAELIKKHKLFDAQKVDFLIQSYWFFRDLENNVQSFEDRQDHLWKNEYSAEKFQQAVEVSKKVDHLVEDICGKAEFSQVPSNIEDQKTWLQSLGFSEEILQNIWPQILSQSSLSGKSFADENIRLRVLKLFMESIANLSLDRNLAASLLSDFFRSVRAKSTFFNLLLHEPRLVGDLSRLFGTSPYLGYVVASRPEILDSLVYQHSAPESEDWGGYLQQLADKKLISEILAGVSFLNNKDFASVAQSLTQTADEISCSLLDRLSKEIGGEQIDIIALGKWGGNEMGFRSDLDFVFQVEADPTELENKVTRRFLTRITEQNRGGSLYLVDLRLRPSGKSGPLLVSKKRLEDYLRNEASPWELQSYLKARSLRGNKILIRDIIAHRTLSNADLVSLRQIRDKLLKNPISGIDLKYQPGGLIDIELAAQTALILNQIQPSGTATQDFMSTLIEGATNWKVPGKRLLKIYLTLRRIEQARQLIGDAAGSTLNANDPATIRLSAYEKRPVEELLSEYQLLIKESDALLQDLDPRRFEK